MSTITRRLFNDGDITFVIRCLPDVEPIPRSQETQKSVGDRVILVVKRYSEGHSNPYVNTEYECVGTVTESDWVRAIVSWDNGYENAYDHDTLVLVRERKAALDPNIAYRLKSRED